MIRVAINGYGRIGRLAHRVLLERFSSEAELVAINAGSSTDLKGWAYLLKYDTIYGPLPPSVILSVSEARFQTVSGEGSRDSSSFDKLRTQNDKERGFIGHIIINGAKIPVFSQKDLSLLPWKDLNVDVVIESTGAFRKEEDLQKHLSAGAKKVVLSAPAKEGQVATCVLSVNEQDYKGESLVSCASCTTNCIAPVAKVMDETFGVEKAMMTMIHAYTSDQRLQDGGHKDYRRARAATLNIIPTSTGAADAVARVLPALSGKFEGLAIRVPVPVGSLSDVTFLLSSNTTVKEINDAFRKASESENYKGIIEVTEEPIVSSDIIGNPHSAIVDLSLTQVVGGNMVKVVAWYDNEWGYANRLVEEAIYVSR